MASKKNDEQAKCSQTAAQVSEPRSGAAIAFAAVCLVICMVPVFGMLVAPTTQTTDNRPLASAPQFLTEEGGVNTGFLQEVTDYVDDHMALRNELVFADALLQSKVFAMSNIDGVTVGTDGWLYYTATLDDFQGRDVLFERELFALAHNFGIIEAYMQEQGIAFVLTVPPNKNTLYPDNMPYYASTVIDTDHSAQLLTPYLAQEQVSYVNLFDLFEAQQEVLYQKRDSHWNAKGAALAYNALMDALALDHEDYGDVEPATVSTASGDLNRMLYSFYGEAEENYDYGLTDNYTITNGAADVTAGWIITEAASGEGTLLMFRDSFADALIPFFSTEFATAYYSKGEPNALESYIETYAPTAVIIEKVERNIANYLKNPPILTPVTKILPGKFTVVRGNAGLSMESCLYDPKYVAISGEVDAAYLSTDTEIVVSVDGVAYETWHTSETGFLLYLKRDVLVSDTADVRVFVLQDDECIQVSADHVAVPA